MHLTKRRSCGPRKGPGPALGAGAPPRLPAHTHESRMSPPLARQWYRSSRVRSRHSRAGFAAPAAQRSVSPDAVWTGRSPQQRSTAQHGARRGTAQRGPWHSVDWAQSTAAQHSMGCNAAQRESRPRRSVSCPCSAAGALVQRSMGSQATRRFAAWAWAASQRGLWCGAAWRSAAATTACKPGGMHGLCSWGHGAARSRSLLSHLGQIKT